MKYKVGDKIRIVKPQNKHWDTKIDHFIGKVMTIKEIMDSYYWLEEDTDENCDCRWCWAEEDFFELVEPKGEMKMKATGIIRRIDELGRMVIPKEIQRALDIREGDPIEVFIGEEGEISLRKYTSRKKMVHRQYYRRGQILRRMETIKYRK